MLPWLICGIAVDDVEKARSIARRCIQLFEDSATDPMSLFGKKHIMAKRFLQYEYVGSDESDIPLRPLLDEFVNGVPLNDAALLPLREWVGALRLLRIVERLTEASLLQSSPF